MNKLHKKIQVLLNEFEDAAIALAHKGGCDPESWEEIEDNYNEAREKLLNHLIAMQNTIKELRKL